MTLYPTFASPSSPAPAGFFMPHGLGRNPAKPLAEAQTGGLYHTALADGGQLSARFLSSYLTRSPLGRAFLCKGFGH